MTKTNIYALKHRRDYGPEERREEALDRLVDDVHHAVRREQNLLGLTDAERKSLIHSLVERVLNRVDSASAVS